MQVSIPWGRYGSKLKYHHIILPYYSYYICSSSNNRRGIPLEPPRQQSSRGAPPRHTRCNSRVRRVIRVVHGAGDGRRVDGQVRPADDEGRDDDEQHGAQGRDRDPGACVVEGDVAQQQGQQLGEDTRCCHGAEVRVAGPATATTAGECQPRAAEDVRWWGHVEGLVLVAGVLLLLLVVGVGVVVIEEAEWAEESDGWVVR